MDIDPPPTASIRLHEDGITVAPIVTTTTPRGPGRPSKATKVARGPPPPPRTLRARASLPTAQPLPDSPASSNTLRPPTEKERNQLETRLGPKAVQSRREELISEKEAELRNVVDDHDSAIREKFHLERFVTMVAGWDPKVAKTDCSPVFLDYKRYNHNLFDHAPPSISTNAVAGPSRPRNSLPARATRHQAHVQTDSLLAPKPIVAPIPAPAIPTNVNGKGKGRASEVELIVDVKGKKKAIPEVVIPDIEATPRGKGKGKMKMERESMPPPSKPIRKKARASISGDVVQPIVERKKPGPKPRNSLPNLPPPPASPVKRGPGRPPKVRLTDLVSEIPDDELEVEIPVIPRKKGAGRPPKLRIPDQVVSSPIAPETPDVETSAPEMIEDSPPPTPAPALPSLAHVPFPPPPIRPRTRRVGPNKIWYSDHLQLPHPAPPHSGNLNSLLTSYISLEDSGPQPDLPTLEARAAREGFIRNRVNWLQSQGRLLRLLDEDEDGGGGHGDKIKGMKGFGKPMVVARKQDHQDHLMSHMRQVRNAMIDEARNKPIYAKKVARMIQAHWEFIEGREDRERVEREKEVRRKGKEVVKGLRKKWGLAVKVVKAKMQEAQKAEQDRLGKEHLQNMLQRSTGLLEAQQQFEGGEDEDSGDDSEDDTEDVSSAEDAEEEGGEEMDIGDKEGLEDEGVVAVDAEAGDGMEVDDVDIGGVMAGVHHDGDNAVDHEAADDDNEDVGEEGDSSDDIEDANVDIRALLTDPIVSSAPSETVPLVDEPHQEPISNDLSRPYTPDLASHSDTLLDTSVQADITSSPTVVQPVATPIEAEQPPSSLIQHTIEVPYSSSPIQPTGSSTPAESSFTLPIRSRRSRKIAPPSSLIQEVDPDADDIEFDVNGDLDEDEDVEMDIEMEDEEVDEKDSEDEGLLADADMPIEELLARYGYSATGDGKIGAVEGELSTNGDISSPVPDQSLLDENLQSDGESPLVVGDGKRQRRVRQVWTPEDNPPPPPKRVRIEDVTPEATPELSSEEEESESEEEEEEEELEEVREGEEGMEVEGIEEDPNAPKIRPPFLLRGTLRPYQSAGLDWLAGLYANSMNGILADEMGLGKTIQTISLLAHLACDRGVWGQHLIIVPTSVILNWEMEFKKFLPGFKVLTYYGNQKERKEKRIGWLTEHSWQVCITSYQIVLADQHIFRRKSWCYMILDEAHNIKNFRSQRWQTLLGFKAQRRLLLTGTPLQNNLMELWSLLHFLMPHGVAEEATAVVGFANHRDFVEWFSNPMDKAVESGDVLDEQAMATVQKLHTLLRPFILRRLKSEVEKQLPGKFEHVVYCRLSRRQRFLYDEFMSRSSTKEALTNGGYLGVMNTLMQLRKVCNHPDLFEVRPVRTSFAMDRSVASDFTPLDILVRKRLLADRDEVDLEGLKLDVTGYEGMSGWTAHSRRELDASDLLPHAIEIRQKGRQPAPPPLDTRTVAGWLKYREAKESEESVRRWRSLRDVNRIRCRSGPIYGSTFLSLLSELPRKFLPLDAHRFKRDLIHDLTPPSSGLILSFDDRRKSTLPLVNKFAVIPPIATARDLAYLALPTLRPDSHPSLLDPEFDTLHHASTKLQIAFPDSSLLQYDCGKLSKLAEMLRDLKAGGHRCLIFTQMTRVLDILEIFLNYNGHRYLRLDGSTKIEDRQIITERFNSDDKIFCFIASSRSGGVGINLTGADTVFFYDSDWNPSMDRQCMDRAHRIGQTREVHIYRFVSSHTVEENMLKKANQKRLLDRVIIQEGEFTTEFFGKVDWRDTLYDGDNDGPAGVLLGKNGEEEEKDGVEDIEVEDEPEAEDVETHAPRRGEEREFAKMVAMVEDEEDVQAARIALGEGEMDMGDFEADGQAAAVSGTAAGKGRREAVRSDGGVESTNKPGAEDGGEETFIVRDDGEDEDEEDDGIGGVDEYMLRLVEWDWANFVHYR